MSEKRSGRGGVLTEHMFSTLFSACVSSFSVCSLSEHSLFLSVV